MVSKKQFMVCIVNFSERDDNMYWKEIETLKLNVNKVTFPE